MMTEQRAERTILHVDMDAFFAAVEVLDHPQYAGLPLAVGGNATQRGVVAAASYEARRFGIHSAMPTATALRLCPQLILLPPRLPRYRDISHRIQQIFARYTPLIEPLSLDEAFLDVTDSLQLFGSAQAIARGIKDDIQRELGLTASVGIAGNKFLAKLASDIDKPDGLVHIPQHQAERFLASLPVSRLWGVGKVTAHRLERMDIHSIADLRKHDPAQLEAWLGRQGRVLWQLAHGRDDRPVVPDRQARSISHEITFAEDVHDEDRLRAQLLMLTEHVAWRLRQSGKCCQGVWIRLRDGNFHTMTRRVSLAQPVNTTHAVWQQARRLFVRHWQRQPLRLIGVGVERLQAAESPRQGELFAEAGSQRKQQQIDRIVDRIQQRFGRNALHRAAGKCGSTG